MTTRRNPQLELAQVLGMAHGVATYEDPLRDPPPAIPEEFDGPMIRSAPPKPKTSVDRFFGALLHGGSAPSATPARVVQSYRPWCRRGARPSKAQRAHLRARDEILLAQARLWCAHPDRPDEHKAAAVVVRDIGGEISGRNRRWRVWRMAATLARGEAVWTPRPQS